MAAGVPTFTTGTAGAVLDTDATLGPTSSITAGTTTLLAGDQLGITKNAVNTLISLEKSFLYDMWTTTNGTFTVPAANATVAITVESCVWPLVGQWVWISDGTHIMLGTITAIGATAGTAQTSVTVLNASADAAFNNVSGTMASGSVVRLVKLSQTPSQNVWASWPAGLLFCPAATLYGVFSTTNSIPFLAFNDSATWTVSFMGMVPWGANLGAGCTVRLKWASHTATTNSVVWNASFERFGTAAVTSDHFGTAAAVTTAVGGTIDIVTTSSLPITYANMGSVVAGDWFRLLIQRIGANGSDTMVGDAALYTVSIESTT